MTYEELLELIESGADADAIEAAMAQADLDSFSDDEINEIRRRSVAEFGSVQEANAAFERATGERIVDFQDRRRSETRFEEDSDLDGDGRLSPEEIAAGEARGTAEGDEGAVQAADAARDELRFNPNDGTDYVNELFNGEPNADQERQFLDGVFEQTGQRFDSIEAVIDAGYLPDPRIDAVIRDVAGRANEADDGAPANPFEPTLSVKLHRRGVDSTDSLNRMYTMTVPEVERAQSLLGITQESLAASVQLADMYDVRRADGSSVAWQPLAALLQATGQTITGADPATRAQLLDDAQAKYEAWKEAERQHAGAPGYAQDVVAQAKAEFEAARQVWQDAAPGTDGPQGDGARNSASQLAARYSRGISMYGGNESLAFLHAVDESLAARISQSGGDMAALNEGDARLVGMYVSRAFQGSASTDDLVGDLVSLGYGEAAGSDTIAGLMSLLQARNAGSGGAGRTRIMPDRVEVEQAAKDFYQQLFLEEPDDATVSSFADQVIGAVRDAPLDQDVDINARIRQLAESRPEYQRLYGNMPGGMNEAEWQGMMRSGQGSILGDEAAGNVAARLGMESGQYQTAVGAAAGTSEAWDNSTFMGRLARAAQVVSANT